MFKEVSTKVDFIAQEHEILDFWEKSDAFRKLVEQNQGEPKWSFIDGPITANNPMGAHHAWGRTFKDLFHRYRAMLGREIRYQNGFDCQGLWVEVEVEKELGLKTKKDIEAYGMAEFVNLCKRRVLKYSAIQTEQSIRLGFWMDWNDPDFLRYLERKMAESPSEVITVQETDTLVTDRVDQIVGRLGLPELGGSYFTFSNENNYCIWKALKKCHERGWIYKGRDVMPWCARCGTGISQHEIVTEGYQERVHRSVYVLLPLRERAGENLLIWTTTPWTLTSNVGAAVHPELTYALVQQDDTKFWLAKAIIGDAVKGDYEIVSEKLGAELEGWTYDGPFDELPIQQQEDEKLGISAAAAHRVILWDEVGEAEGTGIVHIAPGCGQEDFELGKEYGLPAPAPLSDMGIFIAGYDWLSGMSVQDIANPIIRNLREKKILYRDHDYHHRYPVCWRCGEDLVFRLVDEWFINMGEQLDKPYKEITEEEKERNLRYQIMESVTKTRWIPEWGYEREMDWLRNMHDWLISKKRYYGLALPIWECHECGNFEVIGDEHELKDRAVEGWEEFERHTPHRPWIDAVKIKCTKCGAVINRIPDVGNPWLDAGIVGQSTLQYRSDPDYWREWFPADLITESFPGQFRNWFYSLLAMSTIMVRENAFKNVQSYATLVAEDGRAMHKSWGNAIWFDDAAEKMGVDVMRWLYCSHRTESDLRFGYNVADETRRRFIIPLWNIYAFLANYARLDKWTPSDELLQKLTSFEGGFIIPEDAAELDRWILSRLQRVIEESTPMMDNYDTFGPTVVLEKFVGELSNWYVRRSRRRFWKSEADADKNAAYETLYTCVVTLTKLLAPFIPFITEKMYQNLVRNISTDAPESVHHTRWPVADAALVDEDLMADMDLAMRVVNLGHAARNSSGHKLRQPLARVTIVANEKQRERLAQLTDIITEELNVKEETLVSDAAELVTYEINLLPNLLGPKYGRLFPKLRKAVAEMDAPALARRFNAGESVDFDVESETITVLAEEVEVRARAKEGYNVAEEQGLVVAIDSQLTHELEREGLARDIVRRIQTMRKDAGFAVSDHIHVYYQASGKAQEAIDAFANYITSETLTDNMTSAAPPQEAYSEEFTLGEDELKLGVVRVS